MPRPVFILAASFFLIAVSVSADEAALTGRQLAELEKNRPIYNHDDATALQMRLVDREGRVRIREFVRYQMKFPEGKKTLTKFLYPDDIRDTGTLNMEVKGEDDIQYLYLPAAQKLRRISGKSQSWVGSDFAYQDIMETDLDDYTFENLGVETVDGYECYKYAQTPVSPDKSIYGREVHWIRKDVHVPVKKELYDKQGKLWKIIHAKVWRDVPVGTPYAWVVICQNMQDGHKTVNIRRWVELDVGLDPSDLSTGNLQKSASFYGRPAQKIDDTVKTVGQDPPLMAEGLYNDDV